MRLNLLTTVDVDNDGTTRGAGRKELTWRGLAEVEAIASVFAEFGLAATWFVRADNQLSEVYGAASFLLERHQALWQRLRERGDALGWHPHLYHFDSDTRQFVADYDSRRCCEKLRAIHSEMRQDGWSFSSVRIGEAFHSREMMQTLADLKLEIDSTAIPGRVRVDSVRRIDWGPTPNEPYCPSRADHRVPGRPSLNILEVPMTTIHVHAPYDPAPLLRYANLAYRREYFQPALERFLDEQQALRRQDTFLTLILHPEEVIPQREPHPLYAGALDEVRVNLDFLLAAVQRYGFRVRPGTMEDVREVVEFENGGDSP